MHSAHCCRRADEVHALAVGGLHHRVVEVDTCGCRPRPTLGDRAALRADVPAKQRPIACGCNDATPPVNGRPAASPALSFPWATACRATRKVSGIAAASPNDRWAYGDRRASTACIRRTSRAAQHPRSPGTGVVCEEPTYRRRRRYHSDGLGRAGASAAVAEMDSPRAGYRVASRAGSAPVRGWERP